MKIQVNGKEVQIAEGTILTKLLIERGLEPERVVVELNNDIARKEDWDSIVLKENDSLEVLRFVGGG